MQVIYLEEMGLNTLKKITPWRTYSTRPNTVRATIDTCIYSQHFKACYC